MTPEKMVIMIEMLEAATAGVQKLAESKKQETNGSVLRIRHAWSSSDGTRRIQLGEGIIADGYNLAISHPEFNKGYAIPIIAGATYATALAKYDEYLMHLKHSSLPDTVLAEPLTPLHGVLVKHDAKKAVLICKRGDTGPTLIKRYEALIDTIFGDDPELKGKLGNIL